MKSFIYIIRLFFLILLTLSIPFFFANFQIIINFADRIFHLKPNPAFSGGEVMAVFMDDFNDDNGAGKLSYPANPAYRPEGTLDLVKYEVYRPQINAPWNPEGEKDYWQIGLTFQNMTNTTGSIHPFSQAVIEVYICFGGINEGSTKTYFHDSALVSFDSKHSWDIMIHIDAYHKTGTLYSYDHSLELPVPVYVIPDKNKVLARIPLNNKLTDKILDGRKTWHYVLIGAYDGLENGNFMRVGLKPVRNSGGGALSKYTPRVYDILVPEGKNQSEILANFNEKKSSYAVLYPIEVDQNEKPAEKMIINEKSAILRKAIENKKAVDAQAAIDKLLNLEKEGAGYAELSAAAFFAGDEGKAWEFCVKALKENPDNPMVLAFRGALTAKKAGIEKSPGKAIKIVYIAYRDLNKSVETSRDDASLITALICRGEVSMAVPEMVFQKNFQGSLDFKKAALLWKSYGASSTELADLFIKAAVCYENSGFREESGLEFYRAKSFTNLSAYAQYELYRHGF